MEQLLQTTFKKLQYIEGYIYAAHLAAGSRLGQEQLTPLLKKMQCNLLFRLVIIYGQYSFKPF